MEDKSYQYLLAGPECDGEAAAGASTEHYVLGVERTGKLAARYPVFDLLCLELHVLKQQCLGVLAARLPAVVGQATRHFQAEPGAPVIRPYLKERGGEYCDLVPWPTSGGVDRTHGMW